MRGMIYEMDTHSSAQNKSGLEAYDMICMSWVGKKVNIPYSSDVSLSNLRPSYVEYVMSTTKCNVHNQSINHFPYFDHLSKCLPTIVEGEFAAIRAFQATVAATRNLLTEQPKVWKSNHYAPTITTTTAP